MSVMNTKETEEGDDKRAPVVSDSGEREVGAVGRGEGFSARAWAEIGRADGPRWLGQF